MQPIVPDGGGKGRTFIESTKTFAKGAGTVIRRLLDSKIRVRSPKSKKGRKF
jgi:hypothetical protein